jgi:hypothetical protein
MCWFELEHRLQYCLRNLQIACNADLSGNILLAKLKLGLTNSGGIKKILNLWRFTK